MAGWRENRQHVFIAVWLALQGFSGPVRGITNDFSAYPTNSQACLYNAASASECNSASEVSGLNECLCTNTGNFITNAAACIGKSDSGDLSDVYSIMSDACAYTNIDIAVSESEFMSAATATSSPSSTLSTTSSSTSSSSSTLTTSSPSSTFTTSDAKTSSSIGASSTDTVASTTTSQPKGTGSTPTSTGTNNDAGMSSTAKTGIVAGACVAGVAIVAAAALFIFRYRRSRRPNDESRPMLPVTGYLGLHGGSGVSIEYTGAAGIAGNASHAELQNLPSAALPYSWKAVGDGSGAEAQWQQPVSATAGWPPAGQGYPHSPQQQQEMFELPAHVPWAEMPATPVMENAPVAASAVSAASPTPASATSYEVSSYTSSDVHQLPAGWPATAYRP